jgi:hypothetical protein
MWANLAALRTALDLRVTVDDGSSLCTTGPEIITHRALTRRSGLPAARHIE